GLRAVALPVAVIGCGALLGAVVNDLCDEGVTVSATVVGRLKGSRGRLDAADARQVRATGAVHRDPAEVAKAVADGVGGVDEGRTRGIELRYESAAGKGGARGRREVRAGQARYVGVAGGGRGDSCDAGRVAAHGGGGGEGGGARRSL